MAETRPKRLTLLYELYLASQASRSFMRLALAGLGISGEEYALYSYLFANGPRTLSQGARDLGMPVTTLATLLAGPVERGEIVRSPHPRDRRARLLSLTDAGLARVHSVMPAFSAAYRSVLAELEARGADPEHIFASLAELRTAIEGAVEDLADRQVTETAQP